MAWPTYTADYGALQAADGVRGAPAARRRADGVPQMFSTTFTDASLKITESNITAAEKELLRVCSEKGIHVEFVSEAIKRARRLYKKERQRGDLHANENDELNFVRALLVATTAAQNNLDPYSQSHAETVVAALIQPLIACAQQPTQMAQQLQTELQEVHKKVVKLQSIRGFEIERRETIKQIILVANAAADVTRAPYNERWTQLAPADQKEQMRRAFKMLLLSSLDEQEEQAFVRPIFLNLLNCYWRLRGFAAGDKFVPQASHAINFAEQVFIPLSLVFGTEDVAGDLVDVHNQLTQSDWRKEAEAHLAKRLNGAYGQRNDISKAIPAYFTSILGGDVDVHGRDEPKLLGVIHAKLQKKTAEKKLGRDGQPYSLNDIEDYFAARGLVDTDEQVERATDRILAVAFKERGGILSPKVEKRPRKGEPNSVDYFVDDRLIASVDHYGYHGYEAKSSGYKAEHITLFDSPFHKAHGISGFPIEYQTRTREQHMQAEMGETHHGVYKMGYGELAELAMLSFQYRQFERLGEHILRAKEIRRELMHRRRQLRTIIVSDGIGHYHQLSSDDTPVDAAIRTIKGVGRKFDYAGDGDGRMLFYRPGKGGKTDNALIYYRQVCVNGLPVVDLRNLTLQNGMHFKFGDPVNVTDPKQRRHILATKFRGGRSRANHAAIAAPDHLRKG